MTGARVKDCIPDLAMFIVEKGDMGLAMGRNMRNLKSVESALRKHVKVLEFDVNVEKFVSNIIHPLVAEAKLEGKNLIIKGGDRETRARLIGRDRSNLGRISSIVKRHFNVEDVSVA